MTLNKQIADYSPEIRQYAANSLLDALLGNNGDKQNVVSQSQRERVAIALLGFDPRNDNSKTISDFNL